MGFLDFLFGARDPTADWRPQRGLELGLDLDAERLSGVGIGDRFDMLAKFGPVEDARAVKAGIYSWDSRGFCATVEQGRVVEFEVSFSGDAPSFAGTIRCAGAPMRLCDSSREADVIAALGEPSRREGHAEEGREAEDLTATLHYAGPRADWMFEFDEEGRLESVWLGKRD